MSSEVRSFNEGIDFRLRFLHVEIEESFVLSPDMRAALEGAVERPEIHEVPHVPALEQAARLALLVDQERPDLVVVTGEGPLLEPGLAAVRACGARVGFFGEVRGRAEPALDLGSDPRTAVESLTGVAREIQ